MTPPAAIAVVAHPELLERAEGAAQVLRSLGAHVLTLGLWDDPHALVRHVSSLRAIVVELLDRPDWAAPALKNLRQASALDDVGTLAAVTAAQVARLSPNLAYDDLTLVPYLPDELYARIRRIEWRRSEFANEERIKIGSMVIDKQAQEVQQAGRAVHLTQREWALLIYLAERRGRLVRREELLARVWGERYEGGARTVDIHVRRLRQKLGTALPLRTIRGSGYKIAVPQQGETANAAD